MRVLLDQGAPYGLARYLQGHAVSKTQDYGWDRLADGDLLTAAEQAGFEVLVTADKNLCYQQNLTGRKIAIVVLGHPPWPWSDCESRKSSRP